MKTAPPKEPVENDEITATETPLEYDAIERGSRSGRTARGSLAVAGRRRIGGDDLRRAVCIWRTARHGPARVRCAGRIDRGGLVRPPKSPTQSRVDSDDGVRHSAVHRRRRRVPAHPAAGRLAGVAIAAHTRVAAVMERWRCRGAPWFLEHDHLNSARDDAGTGDVGVVRTVVHRAFSKASDHGRRRMVAKHRGHCRRVDGGVRAAAVLHVERTILLVLRPSLPHHRQVRDGQLHEPRPLCGLPGARIGVAGALVGQRAPRKERPSVENARI